MDAAPAAPAISDPGFRSGALSLDGLGSRSILRVLLGLEVFRAELVEVGIVVIPHSRARVGGVLLHQRLRLCAVSACSDGGRDSLPSTLLDVVDLALRLIGQPAVCVHLRHLGGVSDVVDAGQRRGVAFIRNRSLGDRLSRCTLGLRAGLRGLGCGVLTLFQHALRFGLRVVVFDGADRILCALLGKLGIRLDLALLRCNLSAQADDVILAIDRVIDRRGVLRLERVLLLDELAVRLWPCLPARS